MILSFALVSRTSSYDRSVLTPSSLLKPFMILSMSMMESRPGRQALSLHWDRAVQCHDCIFLEISELSIISQATLRSARNLS